LHRDNPEALLRLIPLNADLSSKIIDACVTRHLPAQTPLQHVGDEPGGLWGLADGALSVEIAPGTRSPQKSFILQPPLRIGAGSLLSSTQRVVGLTTTRASKVVNLPASRFRSLAAAQPEIWKWVAETEHKNALIALAMADALMTRGSKNRVLAVLRCLCLHNASQPLASGAETPDHCVDLDLTQAEFAEIANISRSALNPVLQQLSTAGILELRRNQMRVTFPTGANLKA
jgi:CRP-like cAMP-binding protein